MDTTFWKGSIAQFKKVAVVQDEEERHFSDSYFGAEYKAYGAVSPSNRPDYSQYTAEDKKQFKDKQPAGFVIVSLSTKHFIEDYYYPVTLDERDRFLALSEAEKQQFVEELMGFEEDDEDE